MIVSNQIKCNECGDVIYSTHIHDYRGCSCGAVSVDGGQSYLRRMGTDYTEQSIVMDDDTFTACVGAVMWAIETNRNEHGIANAVIRALRDCGYDMNKFGE